MNKKDIEIAKKTLKILSKKSWSSITYNEVLTGIKKIPKKNKNKNDLLKNINRYIDFLLKIDMKSIEISTKKDMLFEVVMARFLVKFRPNSNTN